MAFYDMFQRLCVQRGVTPTKVARDIGIAQPVVSQWKKRGSTPKAQTIQKLADYFGVSTDDLIDDETTVIIPAGVSFTENMGGKAKATTQDETLRLMKHLERHFVDVGWIKEGEDLSDEDTEFLLLIIRQMGMWFEKRDEQPRAAPESTPPSPGGQSTTQPPDAPERPPEGE